MMRSFDCFGGAGVGIPDAAVASAAANAVDLSCIAIRGSELIDGRRSQDQSEWPQSTSFMEVPTLAD